VAKEKISMYTTLNTKARGVVMSFIILLLSAAIVTANVTAAYLVSSQAV
jgi:hypothetical protein